MQSGSVIIPHGIKRLICAAMWHVVNLLLLLLLLLLLTANGFIPGGNVLQCKIWQYSTIQYITIAHFTQNNIEHPRQPSICNIIRINQEHILYTIKTRKQVEPKVDESVLKTTRYAQQWVNLTIQYSISHISPRPTPHSTSLSLYALHFPTYLNSLPFTSFSWSPPLLKFPSLHLSALNTFLTSLYILDFLALQNPFTSLHLSHFSPCSWKYSTSSSLLIYFTSLITNFHFTYHTGMKHIKLHVHGTFCWLEYQ
jgi:hypothetical protein